MEEQEKVKKPKSVVLSFLMVLGALLFAVLVFLVAFNFKAIPFLTTQAPPTATPTPTPAPRMTLKVVPLENDSPGARVLIAPIDSSGVEVSAFQIRLNLPSGFTKDDITIAANPDLESQGWKFPLMTVDTDFDGVNYLKLAGVRLGNSPFSIDKDMLFFAITAKKQFEKLPEVDSSETIIYSSNAVTKLPFNVIPAN